MVLLVLLYLKCAMVSLVLVTHASNGSSTNAGGRPMSPSPSPSTTGSFHLSPGANVQQPDNFHPSIAVIIAILSTMFAITFLLLLYAKHCKQPPFSVYYGSGSSDLSILPIAAPAHPHMAEDAAEDVTATHHPLFMSREAAGGGGLDPFVIESLPSFPFSSLRGTKDGLECAVCLSGFASHEVLRLLPSCHHAFHTHCVDTWLAHHSTCPLCRRHVGLDSLLLLETSFGLRPPSSGEPPSLRQSFRFPLADAVAPGNGDHHDHHALEFYVERDPDPDPDLDASSRLGIGIGSSSRFTIGSSNRHIASAGLGSGLGSSRHGWSGSWRKDLVLCGGSGRASSRREYPEVSGSIRKYPAGTSAREHRPIHETIVEDPDRIKYSSLAEEVDDDDDDDDDAPPPLRASFPNNALRKREIPMPFCRELLPPHLQHMDEEELVRRLGHRVTMSDGSCRPRRWSDVAMPSHIGVSYLFTQRDRHFVGGHGGIIDDDGTTRISNNSNNNNNNKVVVDVEMGETEIRNKLSALGGANNIQRRCMSEIPGLHRSTNCIGHECRLPDGDQLDTHRRKWVQTTRRTLQCLVGRHYYMSNPSVVLGDDPSCNDDGPTVNITKC